MEFVLDICPICGSKELKILNKKNVDEDIIVDYKCIACGELLSSEVKRNKFVKEKEQVNNIVKETSGVKTAKDIFKDNIDSVLEIYCNFTSKATTGTGFIFASNYVITNAHLVFDETDKNTLCDNVFAKFNSSDTLYELEFVFASKELDICILHFVYEGDFKVLSLTNHECETGEKVYTIGNSKGLGLAILDGIISDNSRKIEEREYIMFTAPVTNGNSGGPIFNESGELIGMVRFGLAQTVGMNYAIPLKVIIDFVKEVEQNEEITIL